MGYQLLEEPLTLEEIKADQHADNFVAAVVPIPLSSAIDHDLEGFLDVLEYAVIGDNGVLTDMEYTVVGTGLVGNEIHIKVTGFAEIV